ncbi:uncharacterized protein LOC143149433 isoform X1 [Ptiloglossa arizonensis]|uniref:uncharacterized protein LOC143149433 isoform X1 n=1 Tax=Ptiloglossa arizonensis TaxID=3350558 RepID=UPI003F9FC580
MRARCTRGRRSFRFHKIAFEGLRSEYFCGSTAWAHTPAENCITAADDCYLNTDNETHVLLHRGRGERERDGETREGGKARKRESGNVGMWECGKEKEDERVKEREEDRENEKRRESEGGKDRGNEKRRGSEGEKE